MSLKDEILAADDLRTEVVHVKEWGRDITLRQLPDAQMDAFIDAAMDQREGDTVRTTGLKARLVGASIVDEGGALVFTPDDLLALQEKSAAAINTLFNAAQKLNNLTDEAVEEALGN